MFVEKTFTIQLPGEVSLDALHFAVDALRSTLTSISQQMESQERPMIALESLSYGSAIVSVGAAFSTKKSADSFSSHYAYAGYFARSEPSEDMPSFLGPATRKLRTAARHSPEGVVLSSEEIDIPIPHIGTAVNTTADKDMPPLRKLNTETFGSLKGRLESLNSRSGVQFVVYDRLFDHAVRGKMDAERAEDLRHLWGHDVSVKGIIRRDATNGRPLSIVKVEDISLRSPKRDPDAWLLAEGVLAGLLSGRSSEELVKEYRESE